MSTLDLRAHIAAPVELVYEVVAGVEQYPEFLFDVASADRDGDRVSMRLRMGLLSVTLVTRARFAPPESIDLDQIEGPFRRFQARWTFAPSADGTDVRYQAAYELPIVGSLFALPAGALLERQTKQQIRAFDARVRELAARRERKA
jgi:ribosome-associated toxin RatA of RatAB toxin-antitoxin module